MFCCKMVIYALTLFSILGCKSLPSQALSAYLGQWERINDEATGDVIEVIATGNNTAYGTLIKISPFSSHFGYKKGDIKWKLKKKISNTEYEIENLNAEIREYDNFKVELLSKNYSDFKLTIIDKNSIYLESLKNPPESIGNKQYWSRIE